MRETHLAYLNLGSNIQPKTNLPKAVALLSKFGEIKKTSSVWESEAVGADGPNYLNVCLLYQCEFTLAELKENVVNPIESALGRVRSGNKFAARTIDIDIVVFDGEFVSEDNWSLAYIIIPLADIFPRYRNPKTEESIAVIATRLRKQVWMEARHGVFTDLR